MNPRTYHLLAAVGDGALALWWALLGLLLTHYLGPVGWFLFGLSGIALVGVFEHLSQLGTKEEATDEPT